MAIVTVLKRSSLPEHRVPSVICFLFARCGVVEILLDFVKAFTPFFIHVGCGRLVTGLLVLLVETSLVWLYMQPLRALLVLDSSFSVLELKGRGLCSAKAISVPVAFTASS